MASLHFVGLKNMYSTISFLLDHSPYNLEHSAEFRHLVGIDRLDPSVSVYNY